MNIPELSIGQGSEFPGLHLVYLFSKIWQGFEYVPGCIYGMVFNIPGFWIDQISAYVSVTQDSEYAWIWLNNAWINCSDRFDYSRVLNMPVQRLTGFWIYLSGSKYGRARNMARLWICKGYTGCWICLNNLAYSLIITQYAWICRNNAEYLWACLTIPE